MSRVVILLTGILLLIGVNFSIWRKERLLANGTVVFLELAPVDPRSLMQGDYMALRFAVQDAATPLPGKPDGMLVLKRDARGVGVFERFDDGTPLAAGELRIVYRRRNDRLRIGTNAFFFQERDEPLYRNARFGELRVDEDGQLLLTGLRDAGLHLLGPAAQ